MLIGRVPEAPATPNGLAAIEQRLVRNAVPDPHSESHGCRECSDARDIAALLAAVKAVLALHTLDADSDYRCTECGQGWPCETAQRITEKLEQP